MPVKVQGVQDSQLLAERFGVVGRLGLQLDEMIVPVIDLTALAGQSEGLAAAGWISTGTVVSPTVGVVTLTSASSDVLVEDVTILQPSGVTDIMVHVGSGVFLGGNQEKGWRDRRLNGEPAAFLNAAGAARPTGPSAGERIMIIDDAIDARNRPIPLGIYLKGGQDPNLPSRNQMMLVASVDGIAYTAMFRWREFPAARP